MTRKSVASFSKRGDESGDERRTRKTLAHDPSVATFPTGHMTLYNDTHTCQVPQRMAIHSIQQQLEQVMAIRARRLLRTGPPVLGHQVGIG